MNRIDGFITPGIALLVPTLTHVAEVRAESHAANVLFIVPHTESNSLTGCQPIQIWREAHLPGQ